MAFVLDSYTEITVKSGKLSFAAHNYSDEPRLEIQEIDGEFENCDCYLTSTNAMQLAQMFDWLNSPECINKCFEHTELGWDTTNPPDDPNDDLYFRISTDGPGVTVGIDPIIIDKDVLAYEVHFNWLTKKTKDEESDPVHYFRIKCTPHEASIIAKVLFNFVFNCPIYSKLYEDVSENDKCPVNIVYKILEPALGAIPANKKPEPVKDINEVYTIDQEKVAEYVNSKIPSTKTATEDYKTALVTSPMFKAIVNKYEQRKLFRPLGIITNLLKSRSFGHNTIASAFVSKEKAAIPASSVVTQVAIFAATYHFMLNNGVVTKDGIDPNVNLTVIANEAFQTLQLAGVETCEIYSRNPRAQESYKSFREYLIEILTGKPYSEESLAMMYDIDRYVASDKYYFSLLKMPDYDIDLKQMSALVAALCDVYFVLQYADGSFDGKENVNQIMARVVRAILVNLVNNYTSNSNVSIANIKSTYGIMMTGFVANVGSPWSIETYAKAYGELLAYNAIVSDTPKSELKVGFPIDF